ncbi:unnamed protein product [Pieris macdunnoughi]|uniref:Uncharacterized protein n=1 Tax=Pieris macdunnoughi TaxID=345717 RepID=A0A821RVV7_9NEOP|nr:unnamed protein product [Pieris macdunnoughi]
MLKVISEGSYQSRIAWKGLPQGSVLSPLLYNIYSHDLEASLKGKVNTLQYADDLLLYISDYGTFILEPCNTVALHKLNIIQSKALRIIAGAMRSSPINALQVECSEAPCTSDDNFFVTGSCLEHSKSIIILFTLSYETSVFTGECFGLLKSLEYILIMKLKNSIILTDAKSALQALERFPFSNNRNNHPVIIACRDLLHQCCIKNYTVSFAWIPGHSGIFGNTKADSLAKAAVNDGDLVPYKNFCCDLALLPKSQLLNSWTNIWRSSSQTKGRYYSTIQEDIPSKPWFSNLTLGKAITSTLIRMRVGHACIPLHLARLNILPNDICECGNDVGDFNHIFFACTRHDRSAFISSLLSIKIPFPTSISVLLSNINMDVYRILASFIFHNNIKL